MTNTFDNLLFDLFTTAMEGGTGYWSECDSYHIWADACPTSSHNDVEDVDGFYSIIHEVEGHTDGGAIRIDRTVMERGYLRALAADDYYWSTGEKPPSPDAINAYADITDVEWDYDAGDADAIVQYGLFGEVVFG